MSGGDDDNLSPEEQARLDRLNSVPMNRHSVNLERVQRCHLGIDDEPMQFDEASIADMLQDVADTLRYGSEAFVLRGIANALRGNDDHHSLVLRQVKRGKWKSPSERTERLTQQINWAIDLGKLEADGWQTDAAVHRVAELAGVGVSTVYAGIKEQQCWKDHLKEISQILDLKGKRSLGSKE